MRALSVALLCLAACAPEPESPKRRIAPPLEGRPVCGWEVLEPDMAHLRVGDTGAAPVDPVLVLSASAATPYADVKRALSGAGGLVRLKLLVGERWLVPVTPARLIAPSAPPDPSTTVTTVIGHRRVTRPRRAPAVRIADLRLEGDSVEMFVEHDRAAGERLAVVELAARLRALDPPVDTFALRASDATSWQQLAAAVVAAACYDRGPGDEPHEVLLD